MYIYKLKVTRVIDGDTIEGTVNLGFDVTTLQRFRLLDIDTPETYRPRNAEEKAHGIQATDRVKELVEGKDVYVKSHKTGKYGRWLAQIYITLDDYENDRQLAHILLEEGLAKKDEY